MQWPLVPDSSSAHVAPRQVVERRTPLGGVLSAPLAAMLGALCLAVLGVIPTAAPTYDTVWAYIMPLAAGLCLLESDLRRCGRVHHQQPGCLFKCSIVCFKCPAGVMLAAPSGDHLL